ncbi:hypothetical protein AC1031_021900 [Aphanomyces cochlioides]|nr:hypothetical protein AC1031_021900 [Aphanomyces cochlioides]
MGGQLHKLPESFELPTVDLATAWKLWWRGLPAKKIPPFCQISPRDISKQTAKKVLSEWRFLMERLSRCYESKTGCAVPLNLSEIDLQTSFHIVNEMLAPLRQPTAKKRQRRDAQMKISTIAKLWRQYEQQ